MSKAKLIPNAGRIEHSTGFDISGMTDEEVVSVAMGLLGKRTSARKAKSSAKNGRLAWSNRKNRANSTKHRKLKKNKSVASV